MMTGLFLLLNIGTSEMMLILFVALFLFGGKKLPELARGLGRGIREFKDASETIKRDISDQINNFEEDIESVKTDIKAITQESVVETDTIEETAKETTEETTSYPAPVNLDHQHEISHSDQYYKNYDYSYPGDPVENEPTTETDQNAINSLENSSNNDSVEEIAQSEEQATPKEQASIEEVSTTEVDKNIVAKDSSESGTSNS